MKFCTVIEPGVWSLTRASPSTKKKKKSEYLRSVESLLSTEDFCPKVQEAVCSCMISKESSEEACIGHAIFIPFESRHGSMDLGKDPTLDSDHG